VPRGARTARQSSEPDFSGLASEADEPELDEPLALDLSLVLSLPLVLSLVDEELFPESSEGLGVFR
jgi:hypothetical protein